MAYSLGSVSDSAYNLIDSVPSAISGTVMLGFANQSRLYLQNFTGTTIGSNAIGESHFNILVNMTASMALQRMGGQGADYNYSIGEFSVSKGADNPNVEQAKFYWNNAMSEMRLLGKSMPVYKVLG